MGRRKDKNAAKIALSYEGKNVNLQKLHALTKEKNPNYNGDCSELFVEHCFSKCACDRKSGKVCDFVACTEN